MQTRPPQPERLPKPSNPLVLVVEEPPTPVVVEKRYRLLFTLAGYANYVWDAVFSPDGRRIVTVSFEANPYEPNENDLVLGRETGRLIDTLSGHRSYISVAAFSLDGRRILTASLDNTARMWGDGMISIPRSAVLEPELRSANKFTALLLGDWLSARQNPKPGNPSSIGKC